MNVTNLNADETEGVFTLDALPESATTAIWVKAKAFFKNGSVGNTVQADPIETNTISVGISTIDTVSFDREATYFDLRGVKVTNPQKGQLYIKVTPARSGKVIFQLRKTYQFPDQSRLPVPQESGISLIPFIQTSSTQQISYNFPKLGKISKFGS